MKKYEVAVRECLVKYVDIYAEDAKDAENKAWIMIDKNEIVIDDMKWHYVDVIRNVEV